MSAGAELLARALAATRGADADALAAQAILADPDLAQAYALRGRVSALGGDCVSAAHYYRVAYNRGDHGPETRAVLAACVAAAGDAQGAAQIRQGAHLSPALESFGELVGMQGGMVRAVLRAPLPPPGQPALLPGSGPSHRPVSRPASGVSSPPAARSRPAPRTVNLGALDPIATPERASAPANPGAEDWLETSHTERTSTTATPTASWLDDPYFSDVSGGSVRVEAIDLTTDPGDLAVQARSPVTGRVIESHELLINSRDAAMPAFESAPVAAPVAREPDLFEARAALAAAGVGGLRLALRLPGPVITAQGQRPQKLGAQMALGLTATELALRDPTANRPPVRLPFTQLRRMDVVRDGQQLSFALADGRQLHFDLRELQARASSATRILIAELSASLRAVGAEVNG